MKRPLVYIAAAVIAAFFLMQVGSWLIVCLGAILISLFKLSIIQLNKRYLVMSFILLVTLIYLYGINHKYELDKDIIKSQEDFKGSGFVYEVNDYGEGYRYVVTPWYDYDGNEMRFKLILNSANKYQLGDEVYFEGEVTIGTIGYNEGSFDLEAYYKQNSIIGSVQGVDRIIEPLARYWLKRELGKLKENHYSRIRRVMPTVYANMLAPMVFGLDTMDESIEQSFQDAGVIHIAAISGLHVTIIVGILSTILSFVTRDTRKTAWGLLVGVVIYCIYTGAHPSTVRASIMIGIYLLRHLFYKRYDKATGMAAAFLMMSLFQPLQVLSPGFMMSFSAVAGIFFIAPRLYVPHSLKDHRWVQSIQMMIGVQIGVAPVLIYYYRQMAVYSILGNLLLVPIVGFVITMTILVICVSFISMTLAEFISGSVFWMLNYMRSMAAFISTLPASTMAIKWPGIGVVVCYYGSVILFILSRKREAISLMVVGMTIFVLYNYTDSGKLVIDILDVGNGDAIVVQYEGRTLIVDGGGQMGRDEANVGKIVLLPYLKYHGVNQVDCALISHSDYDHIYGIIELMDYVPIKEVVLSSVYQHYEDELIMLLKIKAAQKGTRINYVAEGAELTLNDMTINVLAPLSDKVQSDNNSHSLVFKFSVGDFDMLFTGDMNAEVESLMLTNDRRALEGIDLLKVAHHGSSTSSSEEFLKAVKPSVALISAGRNNFYGHPNKAVVDRLAIYSGTIYSTQTNGQIKIVYKNGHYSVTKRME